MLNNFIEAGFFLGEQPPMHGSQHNFRGKNVNSVEELEAGLKRHLGLQQQQQQMQQQKQQQPMQQLLQQRDRKDDELSAFKKLVSVLYF